MNDTGLQNTRPRGRVAKNAGMQYLLQAAKYLFPFITIPYLTRVLGPDVYAIRAYILAAMTFVQVFLDYGFTSYGTREISRNREDSDRISQETTNIALLRLLLCLAVAVPVAIITAMIPLMAANPVYVAIAYVCACFKAMLPDYVFQGLEDMAIITYRFVVSQAIAIVLIFLLVAGPEDLLWVPAIEALAAFVALAWSWANVFRARGVRLRKPEKEGMRIAFKTASVFFVSNAATTAFTCLTTIMIGILIEDDAQIAYWSLAMTAVTAIQALYSPIVKSLYPHMCAARDFALAKKLLLIGLPVVLVGTIAFALLGDQIMLLLGGEEYLAGSRIVTMVSPVVFLSYPAMLLGFPVLAAVGREKQLTMSSVIACLFHIAGLALLAIGGRFTIPALCVLRCLTELVLCVSRVWYVLQWNRAPEGELPEEG